MKQTYKLIFIALLVMGLCGSGAQAQLKTTTYVGSDVVEIYTNVSGTQRSL
jgi:hypothetical protein